MKRSNLLILVLLFFFFMVFNFRIISVAQPVETQTPFKQEVRNKIFDIDERGIIIPGRVLLVLQNELWNKEFPYKEKEEKPFGTERLKVSRELNEIFKKYSLERIWRLMPQLEQKEDTHMKVITYKEWVKKRHEKNGIRKNARPYEPPDLPLAEATFDLKFTENIEITDLIEDLKKVPGVISVEPVFKPVPDSAYFPNDPGWVDPTDPIYNANLAKGRWGFHNINLGPGYRDGFDIRAPEAWEFQRGNSGLVVAVVEGNGVDVTHPDLYLNIFLNKREVPEWVEMKYKEASTGTGFLTDDGLPEEVTFYDLNIDWVKADLLNNPNCIEKGGHCTDTNGNGYIDAEDVVNWWSNEKDEDFNGYADDLVGWDFIGDNNIPNNRPFGLGKEEHATQVAGLIAAIADNGKGISGVAARVRIMPVRTTLNILNIAYLLDFNEVAVINASYGSAFSGGTQTMIENILHSLEYEGITYIASLGNDNVYTYGRDPARRETVISVSNFGPDGTRSIDYKSNYGPHTDVAAPGHNLSSLKERDGHILGTETSFSGTSASAPMVSGLVALLLSEDATITPEQIRQIIRRTATDPIQVPNDRGENIPGWDLYSGWGMINARAALDDVRSGKKYPETNIISLPVNYRNMYRNEEFSIQSGRAGLAAYLGLAESEVDWVLRRNPDWDLSNAVVVASGSRAAYSDGNVPFCTIDTDALTNGRHVLELETITSRGIIGKDRAVIDLPRAYISNVRGGQSIIDKIPIIKGFAYGPGFKRYSIHVAAGHNPAPSDLIKIYDSSVEKAPHLPIAIGEFQENEQELMPEKDIHSLPNIIPESGEMTILLTTEGDSTWNFTEKVIMHGNNIPIHHGFPIAGFYKASSAPIAYDLDADGQQDLVLSGVTGGHGVIKALKLDGNGVVPLWTATLPSGEEILSSPAAGDVDGDGFPELVVRTELLLNSFKIRIFNHDGAENVTNWPVSFSFPLDKRLSVSPVLADVTQDGNLDILVSIPASPPVNRAMIKAYTSDCLDVYKYVADNPGHTVMTQPAVGDIDGDGESEIAAISYYPNGACNATSQLYVWKKDGTLLWSRVLKGGCVLTVENPPILMDVNGDGLLEIIAAEYYGYIRVYNVDGTLLWEKNVGTIYSGPIAADFQPGSIPDEKVIVLSSEERIGNYYGAHIRVLNGRTGADIPGWINGLHFGDGKMQHQPLIANLTGDTNMEIAVANSKPPSWYIGPEVCYKLSVVDSTGNLLSDSGQWPIYFNMPLSSPSLLSDVDGDGLQELIAQTQAEGGNLSAKVYVFDLTSDTSLGQVAWGEYAHDSRRSGNYHGDLTIVSPNITNTANIGPSMLSFNVRVRFSQGVPFTSTDLSQWIVKVGGLNANVRNVAIDRGIHILSVEIGHPLTDGKYAVYVEFNDGIKTWDTHIDAVRYSSVAPSAPFNLKIW